MSPRQPAALSDRDADRAFEAGQAEPGRRGSAHYRALPHSGIADGSVLWRRHPRFLGESGIPVQRFGSFLRRGPNQPGFVGAFLGLALGTQAKYLAIFAETELATLSSQTSKAFEFGTFARRLRRKPFIAHVNLNDIDLAQ